MLERDLGIRGVFHLGTAFLTCQVMTVWMYCQISTLPRMPTAKSGATPGLNDLQDTPEHSGEDAASLPSEVLLGPRLCTKKTRKGIQLCHRQVTSLPCSIMQLNNRYTR